MSVNAIYLRIGEGVHGHAGGCVASAAHGDSPFNGSDRRTQHQVHLDHGIWEHNRARGRLLAGLRLCASEFQDGEAVSGDTCGEDSECSHSGAQQATGCTGCRPRPPEWSCYHTNGSDRTSFTWCAPTGEYILAVSWQAPRPLSHPRAPLLKFFRRSAWAGP